MEWKHERHLIPFEDFDGVRNLRQFRVSPEFSVKNLQFAVLGFFSQTDTAEPVQYFCQQIKFKLRFKHNGVVIITVDLVLMYTIGISLAQAFVKTHLLYR